MSKPFELYISILLSIIFLLILPFNLKKRYEKISEDSNTRYEEQLLIWTLETNRYLVGEHAGEYYLPMSLVNKDYDIVAYSKNYAPLVTTLEGGRLYIPVDARYVKFRYGDNTNWIVYDRE